MLDNPSIINDDCQAFLYVQVFGGWIQTTQSQCSKGFFKILPTEKPYCAAA